MSGGQLRAHRENIIATQITDQRAWGGGHDLVRRKRTARRQGRFTLKPHDDGIKGTIRQKPIVYEMPTHPGNESVLLQMKAHAEVLGGVDGQTTGLVGGSKAGGLEDWLLRPAEMGGEQKAQCGKQATIEDWCY